MSMRHKLLALLRNPLVLVPPVILLLGLGWQQYTYAGRTLSLPDSGNIFPDTSFSRFTSDGYPTGWTLRRAGDLQYSAARGHGYATGSSYQLTVRGYRSGDLMTATPSIPVQPRTTYLFKAYYAATATFSFSVRLTYTDGSAVTRFVSTYPSTATSWSTTAYAFDSGGDIRSVQLIYRLSENGALRLNSPYLLPRQDVFVQPAVTGENLIPNPRLAPGAYTMPENWSTYQAGDNTAAFSYDPAGADASMQVQLRDYRSGEAKWQYPPTPVQPYQYYQFSVEYRSDIAAPIVAEYVRTDGRRIQQTVGQAMPADDWTEQSYQFEVPPDATSLFVSVPLRHNGTLATRRYRLIDRTRSGIAHWNEPLVSVTFDDGWQLSYDNALPLLQKWGYKATFYVNPAAIETPGFMTADELASLGRAGHEIGAHGYEHEDLTAISSSALEYQLHQGRDYLRRAGYTVTDAATPYGRSDPEVTWYARQFFTTLRSTDTGINTRQDLDPYHLRVLYINDFTTPQTVADALDQAKAYDGWLILVYHRVGGKGDIGPLPVESSTTTTAALQTQLGLVHSSGIRVLPVAAAYTALEQQ